MPKDRRIFITLTVDMPDHPKLATLTKVSAGSSSRPSCTAGSTRRTG